MKEKTKEKSSGACGPQEDQNPETGKGAEVKASEVETYIKAKKKLHQPDSFKALEFLWKERVARITGGFAPNLKGTECGQLKLITNVCLEGRA